MSEREAAAEPPTSPNVRIVTLEEALAAARAELDEFERQYGVSSEHLEDAFTDEDGQLHETGQYVRWMDTLERWRDLKARSHEPA